MGSSYSYSVIIHVVAPTLAVSPWVLSAQNAFGVASLLAMITMCLYPVSCLDGVDSHAVYTCAVFELAHYRVETQRMRPGAVWLTLG
jgi:hypothetical protein